MAAPRFRLTPQQQADAPKNSSADRTHALHSNLRCQALIARTGSIGKVSKEGRKPRSKLTPRLGGPGGGELDLWLHKAGVEIVAVGAEQADHARRAQRRFGRGRHPAGPNFGDCFSYAPSVPTREPLLFKGDDFSKTDIEAA